MAKVAAQPTISVGELVEREKASELWPKKPRQTHFHGLLVHSLTFLFLSPIQNQRNHLLLVGIPDQDQAKQVMLRSLVLLGSQRLSPSLLGSKSWKQSERRSWKRSRLKRKRRLKPWRIGGGLLRRKDRSTRHRR